MYYKKELIAVLDPMCSWCWGFEPVLKDLQAYLPKDTKLSICMGGLRSKGDQAWTDEFQTFLYDHWTQIQAYTGQKFNLSFLEKDHFEYDTEPACRAVVCVREMDEAKVFSFMNALQKAFYQDARDITSLEVLSQIAIENGFDKAGFTELFLSERMKKNTLADKYKARSMGANAFPSLVFIDEEGHLYVLKGYKDFQSIKAHL